MYGVFVGARRAVTALFLIGAGLALAGCSTSGYVGAPAAPVDRSPAMYGPITDSGYQLASVSNRVQPQFKRQLVRTPGYIKKHGNGVVVVDTAARYLYFTQADGWSMRYGIGVGRAGFAWAGEAVIKAKRKWPAWHPPKEMIARDPLAAEWANGMPGGPQNPLGARALYLFQGNRDTLYRLHGTNDPGSIGKAISSGCVRLLNHDIIDLYDRVPVGTRVVVLGQPTLDLDAIGSFFSSLLDI